MGKYCICFCRVSTQQQDLVQQTNAIVAEAIKMGYDKDHQILIEYKESGISLSVNERAGIDKLKDSINTNPDIDCVICWELSRIGRRADVIYDIRDFFLEHKVQWVVMNPYMRLLENDGKMSQTSSIMLALFTSLAESEMAIKKERFARGRARAKELGKYTGGVIQFGYKVDKNGYLVVNEETAPIVRMMFTMYSTGKYSVMSLSKEMKDLGYFESFTTLPAIKTFLYKVLKQKNYCGDNHHPSIISEDLYNCVQQVLKGNIIKKPSLGGDVLCKRILFDENGYGLTYKNRSKSGVDCIYCSSHMSGYKCSISQKTIEPFVWEISKKFYIKYLMNETKLRKQQAEKVEVLNKKYRVSMDKIDKIQEKIDRTEERYIHGKISLDKVNDIVNDLKEEQREYKNKAMVIVEQIREMSRHIQETVLSKDIDLDKLPFNDRCEIVHNVIERIVVIRPNRRSYTAFLEVYPKVNNTVYKYKIKTPIGASKSKVFWEELGVRQRKEGDIIDVSRRWSHIPIITNPKNNEDEISVTNQ